MEGGFVAAYVATMVAPPTVLVVLAVVVHEGRYLVVEERDGTWFLPAGRVEAGEDLVAAALRETEEEAGVAIALRGLLGFDHSAGGGASSSPLVRLRFGFLAYPTTRAPPKSQPDRHTLGARWATKDEIARLPLRHPEILRWIERAERVLGGEPLLPLAAYEWIAT